jgi:serine/threonine protein kinase
MITKKMCFWDYRDDSYSGGDSSGYDDKESKLQLDLIYSVKGVNGEKEIPGMEECCEKTKDLLDKLLLYDFTLRITASEALNHELFAPTKILFV